MKEFVQPEIKIIKFEVEDIITASGDTFNDKETGEWT